MICVTSIEVMKAMKVAHRVFAIIWLAICGYFFASLTQVLYEYRPNRWDTFGIMLFFVLLYLTGAVASFYLIIGAKWPRFVLSIVALLTVTASVMGLFAFFNAMPFSFVGIMFDIFAIATVMVLLIPQKKTVH